MTESQSPPRDFKGLWIPREIWLHAELSIQEKALWAEIDSLYDQNKNGCWASNEYLAGFFGVQVRRMQEMISKLKSLGLVEQVSFNGRERVIKAVWPQQNSDREKESADQTCRKVHGGHAEKCTPDVSFSASSPIYITKRENKDDKDIAQTPPEPRKKATDISFSFEQKKFINITAEDLKIWKELYPSINIDRELKEMIQWLLSNPTKAKTKKLWRKFLVGWLSRSHEKATNKEAYQQHTKKTNQEAILARHTGFQQDNRPRDPRKIIDCSNDV